MNDRRAELRRYCGPCGRWQIFDVHFEGNLSTGEQWTIYRCSACSWVHERIRTRCPVVHVRAD